MDFQNVSGKVESDQMLGFVHFVLSFNDQCTRWVLLCVFRGAKEYNKMYQLRKKRFGSHPTLTSLLEGWTTESTLRIEIEVKLRRVELIIEQLGYIKFGKFSPLHRNDVIFNFLLPKDD